MTIKCGFTVILIVTLFLSGVVGTRALSPPLKEPFVICSQDGNKFFRFTLEESINTELRTIAVPPTLRVYYDTNPPQFIYEIDSTDIGDSLWVDKRNFYFSRDFMHLAFLKPSTGIEALKFFSQGDLMKIYYISELIEDIEAVESSRIWGFAGWMSDIRYLLQYDILMVTTIEDRTFLFDITTGDIIEDHSILRTVDRAPETGDRAIVLYALGFAALAGAKKFIKRRWRE